MEKDADKKGDARMRRYEEKVAAKKLKEDERSITFWEKIGENGSWEEKEYVIKVKPRG